MTIRAGISIAVAGILATTLVAREAQAGSRGLGIGIAAGVIAGGLILNGLQREKGRAARAATRERPPAKAPSRAITRAPVVDDDDIQERIAIQKALAELGFDVGTPDGRFGPQTRKAISSFQESIGHEPTGELTKAQKAELLQPPVKPTGAQIGAAAGSSDTGGESTSGKGKAAAETPSESAVPPRQGGIASREAQSKLDELLSVAKLSAGGRLRQSTVKPDGSVELVLASAELDGGVAKASEGPDVTATGPSSGFAVAGETVGDRTRVTLTFTDPATRTLMVVGSRSFDSADDARMWMKGLQAGLTELDALTAKVRSASEDGKATGRIGLATGEGAKETRK